MFEALAEGAALAFTPATIAFVLVGLVMGVTIGAIPGLSGDMAIAVLLPFVFGMEPAAALGLLLGIYKGSMFGGSISAIAFGVPGTAGAAATVIDGYQARRNGEPNRALHTALYSSLIGDTSSDLVLIFLAIPLALVALSFGPVEFFALYVFALVLITVLTTGLIAKATAAAGLGILISMIGRDPITGSQRLTFGFDILGGGVGLIPLLVGVFAVSEILHQVAARWARKRLAPEAADDFETGYDVASDRLRWRDFTGTLRATAIGTGVGTFIGALPGAGSSLAAFMSYSLAQRFSRRPERFGKGALEGVASAEAGNSATSGSTLIPLFAFGIPGSATAALIGAALILMGINPGPTMIDDNIGILYAIFVILIYANAMNLGVCKLLLPVYSRVSMIQPRFVLPVVLCLTILGTYAAGNSLNDVWLLFLAGLLGVVLRIWGMPLGPLVLGFIIGPGMERSLRQALLLSGEDWAGLLASPIALGLYGVAGLVTLGVVAMALRRRVATS